MEDAIDPTRNAIRERPGLMDRLARLGDQTRGQHWRAYLGGILTFYLVLSLATQFRWFLAGSMSAEMGTNYYIYATAPHWIAALVATDAGYIPLPQRLIAAVIARVGVSASAVPYCYQVSAFVAGAMLVSAFAHRRFRPLVHDDRVRALVCLAVCCLINFDVRSFINFTYTGIFLTVPLVALAMTPKADDAPWWAWAMPLLMLSKPIELALMPAIALGILMTTIGPATGKPRFRAILIVSFGLGIAQLARLMTGPAATAAGFADPHATVASKLATTMLSGFGTLGGFTLGPPLKLILGLHAPWLTLLIGAGLTLLYLAILARLSLRTPPLILAGASLLFATCLLNSFGLSTWWNLKLAMVRQIFVERWTLGCIAGAIFCLAGAGQALVSSNWWRQRRAGVIGLWPLALGWFAISLWPVAITKAFTPPYPTTGLSYWSQMGSRIDSGKPVCVPIDPYREADGALSMYRRDCSQLNPGPLAGATARPLTGAEAASLTPAALGRPLLGLVAFVRPGTWASVQLHATARTADGRTIVLSGQNRIAPSGGIVLLSPPGGDAVVLASPLSIAGTQAIPLLRNADGTLALVALGLDRETGTTQP